MRNVTLFSLVAVLTLLTACNRESARARRGAKPAVAEHHVTITDANFDREVVQSFQPVLIEFWHESSEDCEKMAPTIETLAVEFDGRLKVGKLNIGANPRLADFYTIRTLPVTILFMGDREVDRFVGVKSKDEIAGKLNKLLPAKK
jgi:thioredoxin 1